MTAVIEKKKKRLVWLKRDWRLYLMLILPIAQYTNTLLLRDF